MERPSSDCERIFSAEKFSLLIPVLLSASSAQLHTGDGHVSEGGERAGAMAAGRLRARSAATPSGRGSSYGYCPDGVAAERQFGVLDDTSSTPNWRAEHRSAHWRSAAVPSGQFGVLDVSSSTPTWRAEHPSAHVLSAAHLSPEPAHWSLPKSQRRATPRIAPPKLQLAPQPAPPRGGYSSPALQAVLHLLSHLRAGSPAPLPPQLSPLNRNRAPRPRL